MAITHIPFWQKNRDFLILKKLCVFASLRGKTLHRDEWIGSEAAAVNDAGV
jgi:hypothetical protein